jgi:hypothetical protein
MNGDTRLKKPRVDAGTDRQVDHHGTRLIHCGQVNYKNTGYRLLDQDLKPHGRLYFYLQEVDSNTDLQSLGGSLSLSQRQRQAKV